jgi:hypothetical protein
MEPCFQGKYDSQHIHYLSGKRFLAWSELDIYCVGRVSCAFVPSVDFAGKKPEEYQYRCGGTLHALLKGDYLYRNYVLLRGIWLDYLSLGQFEQCDRIYSRHTQGPICTSNDVDASSRTLHIIYAHSNSDNC